NPAGYSVSVTINHDAISPVTVTSTIFVSDPAVTAQGAGAAFTAVEGAASACQTVGALNGPGGYEAEADYSVTINWGDNTTSSGTISSGTMSGSHQYAEEGNYTITVTVHHDGAPDATAVTTAASVSDPAVAAKGASATFTAVEGAASA